MDLIDEPETGGNAHEYTVSEISGAVKRVIEGEFGRVRVRGEVGRVFPARSGHLYFDIKDDRSVLASVAWKGQVAGLAARPEEGMEVVATGRLTTFGSQSKYQLNVDDLRPAGVGALMAMLEKRKAQLQAEGLFDPARKQKLPFLPEVIGVVTSPSGAVIRDILHRLRERFPRRVLVWPVAVQGQQSAAQVARAIDGFNALSPGGAIPRPDLLIVARGGGSIEDLWSFNEEIVARAAAASRIPLISAVGHETDTTLIDFVSDRRAPTPSAAAEMAVPVRLDLAGAVEAEGARLSRALAQGITARRQRARDLARALPRADGLTAQARQRLDHADLRLPMALRGALTGKRARLAELGALMRPRRLQMRLGDEGRGLAKLSARLRPGMRALLARRRDGLHSMAARVDTRRMAVRIGERSRALDGAARSLRRGIAARLTMLSQRLTALERMRETLGYRETLSRGYAVVWSGKALVTGAAGARKAAALEIEFHDGKVATVARKPSRKGRTPPPEQGKLL